MKMALSCISRLVGLNPLSPAVMTIPSNGKKSMRFPLNFAMPGEDCPPPPKSSEDSGGSCTVVSFPERVVAVRTFSGASVEAAVRQTDRELRNLCTTHGLRISEDSRDVLCFAQYDAIFSMGKRRTEVWVDLADNHPWST